MPCPQKTDRPAPHGLSTDLYAGPTQFRSRSARIAWRKLLDDRDRLRASAPPYLAQRAAFFFTVIVTGGELVVVAPLLSVAFAVSTRVPAAATFHL